MKAIAFFRIILGISAFVSTASHANSAATVPPDVMMTLQEGDANMDALKSKIEMARSKQISDRDLGNYYANEWAPKNRKIMQRMDGIAHTLPQPVQTKWATLKAELNLLDQMARKIDPRDPDPFNRKKQPERYGVSIVRPDGWGDKHGKIDRSVSSYSVTPASEVTMDRVGLPNDGTAKVTMPRAPVTKLTGESHDEIARLKSVMTDALTRLNLLNGELKKGTFPEAEYARQIDREIKPALEKFKTSLKARKIEVAANSYYVRVIEEQIRICDMVLEAAEDGRKYTLTKSSSHLAAQATAVSRAKKMVEYIPVKYQTLDTR